MSNFYTIIFGVTIKMTEINFTIRDVYDFSPHFLVFSRHFGKAIAENFEKRPVLNTIQRRVQIQNVAGQNLLSISTRK